MRSPALALVLGLSSPACVVAMDRSYTIEEDVHTVVVDLGKGDLHVEAGEPGRVEVDVDLGGLSSGRVGPHFADGVLYLDYSCGDLSLCGGDLSVRVPPRVGVDVELGAGDLHLSRLEGRVAASLGSGDLSAEGLAGDTVWLALGAGDLSADFVERPAVVQADLGAGDLWLGLPPGAYDLHLDAGAGAIITGDIVDDPGASSQIHAATGAGALTVEGWTRRD